MEGLLKKIGYIANELKFIKKAFTHSSYANEKNTEDNERLEFLGDAVLELIVSTYLYNKKPKLNEGEMTRLRANIVCESHLAYCANLLELGKYVRLGKGEKSSGGQNRQSILSDTFEAFTAAIYLDGGYEKAQRIVVDNLINPYFKYNNNQVKDFKTLFQEKIQSVEEVNSKSAIEYIDLFSEGPDHEKIFHVELRVGNIVYADGTGKSKKQAQQKAAQKAYEKLND